MLEKLCSDVLSINVGALLMRAKMQTPLPQRRGGGSQGRVEFRPTVGIVLILCICFKCIGAAQPYSMAAEMPLTEAAGK